MPQDDSASTLSPSEVRDIVRLTNDAVVTWNSDVIVTGWNPSAARMCCYSLEEVLGKPLQEVIAANEPEGRLAIVLERVRQGEVIEDLDMQWVRKDGKPVDVSVTFAPLRNDHQKAGGVCIASDLSIINRLRRAERDQLFLAAVISSAEDAIISVSLDGIVTTWNSGAERIFGQSAKEMIGSNLSVLVPASHLDEGPALIEQLQHGSRIEHYETQRMRKDGQVIDVSMTVSPIRDSVGRLIGASAIVRDITDRKAIAKAERDQLFLASIVSSAEDAIISKDLQGVVTSWNRAAENIFGYTAEEMIGKPISLLIPPDQPDEGTQILSRIRRGERIEHHEARRLRKDGTIIDVSLTISPMRDRIGRIVGASKIARDISDRQRWYKAEAAESFLGALVESAADAIVSKDLNGIVTSWNAGAQRIFGYSAAEIIGKPISLLIPADKPDEEPRILQRIRRGERIAHYETKRVRKDGQVIDVSLTVSPIRDQFGRVIAASKIARDISESKRAATREREALREAQESRRQADVARKQAEEANAAKDEFLATISHELRTPITAILGWTRMLVMGQLDYDRQQKAFEIIDRNARAQAQLIEDLLDVSRIISGKMRVDFKSVDVTGVISSAIEALRPAAEAKRIRINFDSSSDAGPTLGDAQRLQQVVWNLLSNAIKFTPRDGAVRLSLRRVESSIELRVADNGVGIPSNFLPHVFNRFSQADSSITRSHGGLGMGLAIVRALVELHGGVVSAASAGEGKGAEFTVKLPISAVHEDSHPQPPAKKRLQAELKSRDDLVGIKLLIVDDEQDTCDLLRFIFNECGAIVETAQSAEGALQTFDRWRPDMIISDIGMPMIDGYELIRIIRKERGSRIPAVALTAMARVEDRIKALSAGYQMHVAKPVDPVELITIISGLVGLVSRTPEP